MGTVRGNIGTVLEHVVLGVVVDWVVSNSRGAPLMYIDTHAMAPMNRPVGRDFNLLEELRCRNMISHREPTGVLATYGEVFKSTWMPGSPEWYPTHFIHAARVAARHGCRVDHLLFETNAPEALPRGQLTEDRRAEISRFLSDSAIQQAAGLPGLSGTLASAPGDFRVPSSWPAATDGEWGALVVMSDPLEYRPEPNPGGSRFGADDFALLRSRLEGLLRARPSLTAQVVFASANLGTWQGNKEAAANHISNAWTTRFAQGAGRTWCGACFWGGFLVFVGIVDRDGTDRLDSADRVRTDVLAALPQLHPSTPTWFHA